MKICHMTSTHRAKDQRIFDKECISLARAGYDVYLVEQGNSEECHGVHIIGTGEISDDRYYRLLHRPKKIYQLALDVDADIYQFHDMELIPYGLKLKKKGKKVIFDYHEDYAARFSESDALPFPKLLRNFLGYVYRFYEKFAIKQFDALISVTPHICDRLKKINGNTEMITNYPLLRRNDWLVATSYNITSDYFCFIGQVSDTYRIMHIVEAIQEIEDVKLKICGPTRTKDYLERIKKCDKKNKVEYLGELEYSVIPDIIRNAKAAFALSQYNANVGGHIGTLGCNKFFETMLCGVPVICTDFILWKEIIEKYECGICVDSYDKKQLIKAMHWIIENPNEAASMGEKGKNAALLEFNWDTQEQKLINLYKKIEQKDN